MALRTVPHVLSQDTAPFRGLGHPWSSCILCLYGLRKQENGVAVNGDGNHIHNWKFLRWVSVPSDPFYKHAMYICTICGETYID